MLSDLIFFFSISVKVIRTANTNLINPCRKIGADVEIELLDGFKSFYECFLQDVFCIRLGFDVAVGESIDHFIIGFVQFPECTFVSLFGQQYEQLVVRVHFRLLSHHIYYAKKPFQVDISKEKILKDFHISLTFSRIS